SRVPFKSSWKETSYKLQATSFKQRQSGSGKLWLEACSLELGPVVLWTCANRRRQRVARDARGAEGRAFEPHAVGHAFPEHLGVATDVPAEAVLRKRFAAEHEL